MGKESVIINSELQIIQVECPTQSIRDTDELKAFAFDCIYNDAESTKEIYE